MYKKLSLATLFLPFHSGVEKKTTLQIRTKDDNTVIFSMDLENIDRSKKETQKLLKDLDKAKNVATIGVINMLAAMTEDVTKEEGWKKAVMTLLELTKLSQKLLGHLREIIQYNPQQVNDDKLLQLVNAEICNAIKKEKFKAFHSKFDTQAEWLKNAIEKAGMSHVLWVSCPVKNALDVINSIALAIHDVYSQYPPKNIEEISRNIYQIPHFLHHEPHFYEIATVKSVEVMYGTNLIVNKYRQQALSRGDLLPPTQEYKSPILIHTEDFFIYCIKTSDDTVGIFLFPVQNIKGLMDDKTLKTICGHLGDMEFIRVLASALERNCEIVVYYPDGTEEHSNIESEKVVPRIKFKMLPSEENKESEDLLIWATKKNTAEITK